MFWFFVLDEVPIFKGASGFGVHNGIGKMLGEVLGRFVRLWQSVRVVEVDGGDMGMRNVARLVGVGTA